ncbi:MAG TPA: amidase [Acidobacteriaceae bacterium]|jgi:aspartyl-tRNA(Asn)/glutamyl-tRNA(Gln) amidotransferase subunit A|nr:amidase [Acidobacteriaceae bacterium]
MRRSSFFYLVVCIAGLMAGVPQLAAQPLSGNKQRVQSTSANTMDRDLMEITVPRLEKLYAKHRYTVTEVTQWYLNRIDRYDGTYRAILYLDKAGALRRAAEEDAEPKNAKHGILWGVPIVVKANTSVKGWVTSAGWKGFLKPGEELVAPRDAMVVQRLREAGAVLLGQTNMPDFAFSDTTRSTAGGRTGDAYDVRFSPGGSSGGTAVAVAANFAVLGTGTDTANSVRQPAANNSLVGMLPTRGLTSIAGINPLDWMRDNTGPLARDVTDAAIALDAMQAEDPLDARTKGSAQKAEAGPYTRYLKKDALKGKRFGVPWFVLEGSPDVYGTGPGAPANGGAVVPETRAAFMKAVEQLRAAGATVIIDKEILPESFYADNRKVNPQPYRKEGVNRFLQEFGPPQYHSVAEFEAATGNKLPAFMLGGTTPQKLIETDPQSEANFWGPQRVSLAEYEATRKRWHLDGFVYPAMQEPSYDETVPGASTWGPPTETAWVNRIGIPAVSVPGGFYANGLPFGLEISGVRWKDGDLLGYAYAYEQATHNRRLPKLVEGQRKSE